MFFKRNKKENPIPFGVLDISPISEVDRLTLDEGPAILVTPKEMSPDSVEDFIEWFFVFMERKERQNRSEDNSKVFKKRRRRTVKHEGLGDKFYIRSYPVHDGNYVQEKLEEKLRILKERKAQFDEAIKRTEELIQEKEIADKVNCCPHIYK